MPPDERAARVALALTPGIGPSRYTSLLAACETALGALSAPCAFLCTIPGISRACATAVRATSAEHGLRVLETVADAGGLALLPGDPEWPARLADIPDAPLALFAVGNIQLLFGPAVAVVGSRDHSAYGAEACRMVVRTAVESGIVVVSGMARGIDAIAHTAALDGGGDSIGVLGNGFGVIYPAANRGLYERMTNEGLLLTEYPPGERPHVGTFPKRNRLISGLASLTLVVEAALGSGALITADTALAQGRDVMALPGPITSATSVGTNRLLRDGATPFLEPPDLALAVPGAKSVSPAHHPPRTMGPPPQLSLFETRLWEALQPDPLLIDQLTERLEVPVQDLLATLAKLEIEGHVVVHPGGRFARAR